MSLSIKRFGKHHIVSFALIAVGAVACSSESHGSGEGASAASAQALTAAKSCQGLDIAARGNSTYAIDNGGQVWGWGANADPFALGLDSGEGLGSTVTAPSKLTATGAKVLSAGPNGACAIVPDPIVGQVVSCWGLQLGAQSSTEHAAHVIQYVRPDRTTSILGGVTAIATGDRHACALTVTKEVWCWGADDFGQLGDGLDPNADPGEIRALHADGTLDAVQMVGVQNVSHIAAAGDSTCVRQENGQILCAGNNFYGQLGQGSTDHQGIPSPTPAAVHTTTPISFASVTGGGKGTFCAASANGGGSQSTYCWGANDFGQTGAGNQTDTPAPLQLSIPNGAGDLFVQGNQNGCQVKADGTVYCWGNNSNGVLPGAGTIGLQPVQITLPGGAPLTNAIKVVLGDTHACALTTTGLVCWGNDNSGQIGDGGATPDSLAVTPLHLSVPALACPAGGLGASCATLTNSCNETLDCSNDCSVLNMCDATTHTCVDNPHACAPACNVGELCNNHVCQLDPNYCSPACGSGEYCSNRQCAAYCATQAITDASVGASRPIGTELAATSPDSYGNNSCGMYIVDVPNANTRPSTEVIQVGPAAAQTEAGCSWPILTVQMFADGKQVLSKSAAGTWVKVGSGGYCSFFGGTTPNTAQLTFPAGNYTDLRIVAKYESSSVNKGSVTVTKSAVKVRVFSTCYDGTKDGDETDVDCGGSCGKCVATCHQTGPCTSRFDCIAECPTGHGAPSCNISTGACVLPFP